MMIMLPLVEGLVAIGFAVLAVAFVFRPAIIRSLSGAWSGTRLFRWPFALACLAGAILMVAAFAVPFLAFFAAVFSVILAFLLVASATGRNARHGRLLAIAIVVCAVAVGFLQPLGLKVLALPAADTLPAEAVAASVVKTYDEGVWFEGISAAADGTLYLSANRDLDFTSADYFHSARGEVIERRTDGTEGILFETPLGATAGVSVVASDGTLYMTSHGRKPGIWKIAANTPATMMAPLPEGAWPNGIDFGPDGMLYAADSSLGLIWRIDPATGKAETTIRDQALAARPFIALAPGANGLHFSGRNMIVTVSDRTAVLDYPLGEDGRFGEPVTRATGIPGDDFAIGCDGSLFVTTHPYNTLVRVRPDGRRSVIADATGHIVGATDAIFGRSSTDRDTLYVVTDGGAFTGGARTRGELVALQPCKAN